VNFRIPPWLDPGPHQVRVRTVSSPCSEPFRIEKKLKFEPAPRSRRAGAIPTDCVAPVLTHLENSVTGTRAFQGYRNEYLICWFTTPETGLTREDVILEIDGAEEPVLFLTDLRGGAWQTNSRLPAVMPPGSHQVRIRTIRSPWSNAGEFALT
jgi:hypothetical protein